MRKALRTFLVAVSFSAGAAWAQSAPPLSHGWLFEENGGAALYAAVCAGCHQPDAQGAVGAAAYPALAGNADLASVGIVERAVLEGLGGMPPVGRMMSDRQAADVINFVRTHFGNSYSDAISAADIKAARPHRVDDP
jgi:mono/diheme cytochrome c family protein